LLTAYLRNLCAPQFDEVQNQLADANDSQLRLALESLMEDNRQQVTQSQPEDLIGYVPQEEVNILV
jgi:hypothetical protein